MIANMAKAINMALHEEMARDERVVVLGEDVGRRGGVFLVTEGLYERFGPERVIDTPLNEGGILGFALGMAMAGLKPVAEIQFVDFIWTGADELLNHIAKLRYRSGGEYKAPLVVRAPVGSGVKSGLYHSQSPEAVFVHTPGLVVVMPSTPYNAKGLLKAAIRGDDPVVFLEPKILYRSPREEIPDGDYVVEIGKARVAREGDDVTVVAYGAMVHRALEAAEKAKASVEVVDLLTLNPMDVDAVLKSVSKTGRLVVAYDAPKTAGLGAEVAAVVAEKALDKLAAPVVRVAGPDVPQSPVAHDAIYAPTVERILKAIEKVMAY
ncbi:Pyruvate/2-oxoglutarate dehydrogenase complex, dehydrogenase (E1) component, beta subunit [Thermoproteus uzoniensis 768-20]|uniref:2-oxoacid oxidoreductase (ferredoxin) n=1 Tax=Thermoproteus uzoniensis (strain 768-20) TaxID=999630 RepID=F2L6B3_THEU7|nr:alpha-ketoacid dehydrogenase subunit beta [Thermoproteus uzoniensis]AEA12509.1 Pyruvate/2-oxoglutarate dehydrogenase complex, dehydrogenase (E1) component, beta subunit [Thermoproteus uzoniensis 768-20]